ncbi:MAG: hypothetical protein ABR507_05155 [Actinomycetota bacterium]|nr:hypothetical protein [Actinomycetota bacterium]
MPISQLSQQRCTTLRSAGAIVIDLRAYAEHLAQRPRGSVSLQFEAGPGFGGRARDLLRLGSSLIIIDDGHQPIDDAAAMLHGKGFAVNGYVRLEDSPQIIETKVVDVDDARDLELLNVADPGTIEVPNARFIPAEDLWTRVDSLQPNYRIGVLAGWGLRAAAAIGILEMLGFEDPVFVRTLPAGTKPRTTSADQRIFRVGGPG